MRRDELLNPAAARTAAMTGFTGIADLVEEICPALHHDATLGQVEGLVVRRFDFILRRMSELHLDMSPLVSHLI
jgi:hypothetical protein